MPSGRVAKGNAYALAQGKSSNFVETIRPERRIGFKFLPDPFRHNPAIAPFEFAADDPGREIPDEPAKNVAAFQAKEILSGSVEGDKSPIRTKREKSLADPFQNGVDG